jgi:hypothetical protein
MWVFAAIVVLVAGVVLVSLSHKPSRAQQASDLTAYLGDVNAGIESCAGGVRDSLRALSIVEGGDTSEYPAAVGILTYNAQNCSPANNEPLQDFTNYQVTESLAQFPLDQADNDVITWAFPDAVNTQQDMLTVLRAKTPAARTAAKAALLAAMRAMNAQRMTVYAIWHDAEKAVGASTPLPYLPT